MSGQDEDGAVGYVAAKWDSYIAGKQDVLITREMTSLKLYPSKSHPLKDQLREKKNWREVNVSSDLKRQLEKDNKLVPYVVGVKDENLNIDFVLALDDFAQSYASAWLPEKEDNNFVEHPSIAEFREVADLEIQKGLTIAQKSLVAAVNSIIELISVPYLLWNSKFFIGSDDKTETWANCAKKGIKNTLTGFQCGKATQFVYYDCLIDNSEDNVKAFYIFSGLLTGIFEEIKRKTHDLTDKLITETFDIESDTPIKPTIP